MAVLPLKDRHYLQKRGIAFQEIDEPQKAVVLSNYKLPSQRFDAANADVLILLPPSYPDCAPDMFYALPWLRLVSSKNFPNAANAPLEFRGQSWQRWSRHNNDWRPGVDGIWTMIKRVETALEIAA